MLKCLNCKIEISSRTIYCSNRCQAYFQYQQYIKLWQLGSVTGNRGIRKKNISAHIKRFLIEKNGEKCSNCGWAMKHPFTNRCPLEIDHIDGNAENNIESNLRLLCPNCHSLTFTFRNLNKGKGRSWR